MNQARELKEAKPKRKRKKRVAVMTKLKENAIKRQKIFKLALKIKRASLKKMTKISALRQAQAELGMEGLITHMSSNWHLYHKALMNKSEATR